jgi:hypothetical protein
MTFFLPLLLTAAVFAPCKRAVPLNFAVEFDDTAQETDFRLEASLQTAANARPALVVSSAASSAVTSAEYGFSVSAAEAAAGVKAHAASDASSSAGARTRMMSSPS